VTLPGSLARLVPVMIVCAVWELLPRLGLVPAEFLPSLSMVAKAWWHSLATAELPYHAAASLTNWAIGLAGSVVVGAALGVLMAWHPLLNATVGPLVQMSFPIPRTALVPVMILWLGLGALSKIAAIFSGCLLPIVVGAYNGARGVDRTLVWSALALGASRRQVLREIVVPGALPDVMAGIRNAIAIAFVLMVTSEFLVGGRGLGYLISFTGDAGAYPSMFSAVLTVAALGFLADRAFLKLTSWVLRWRE
jgi:NitT/TauT family transport system permease protein